MKRVFGMGRLIGMTILLLHSSVIFASDAGVDESSFSIEQYQFIFFKEEQFRPITVRLAQEYPHVVADLVGEVRYMPPESPDSRKIVARLALFDTTCEGTYGIFLPSDAPFHAYMLYCYFSAEECFIPEKLRSFLPDHFILLPNLWSCITREKRPRYIEEVIHHLDKQAKAQPHKSISAWLRFFFDFLSGRRRLYDPV